VVLAGLKGPHRLENFPSDEVVLRMLEIRGVRAVDYASFQQAIRVIEGRKIPLERLHTHEFPLERAADAVRTLSGETGSGAIHVTIEPGL
jgi:threonine dehydrogenase-like Zn-dependent dehydrogenase